jgi:GH24 family phage-related lysozyme (muramidase)
MHGDVQKMALDAFLKSPEGKKYAAFFEAEKATKENSFKAPEGFSNVVGVGANPVLQAMDESLTESKKQTNLLEDISANQKKGQYDDFTKTELNATRNASVMSSI